MYCSISFLKIEVLILVKNRNYLIFLGYKAQIRGSLILALEVLPGSPPLSATVFKSLMNAYPRLELSYRFYLKTVITPNVVSFNIPPSNSILDLEESTGLVNDLVDSSRNNLGLECPPPMALFLDRTRRYPFSTPPPTNGFHSKTCLGAPVPPAEDPRLNWSRSHQRTNSLVNQNFVGAGYSSFCQHPVAVMPVPEEMVVLQAQEAVASETSSLASWASPPDSPPPPPDPAHDF